MLSPVGCRLHGSIHHHLIVLLRGRMYFCPRYLLMLWRCSTIGKKENNTQINEEIRDKELRVIGPDGQQLGIMSSRDALNIAEQKNLDLVKIAPQASPPVCKIMDYGKYRFEQAKREKDRSNIHIQRYHSIL